MVWGMVIGRFLDVVCPGAGIVLDIYEAMQIVQDGIQAGEIAEAAGEHLLEQLSSEKRRGATRIWVSELKGRVPDSIWYSTTPRPQASQQGS